MFVAMKRVGAANSEGVLYSAPFSLAKGFIEYVIQRIGTSRSSEAKPHCAVAATNIASLRDCLCPPHSLRKKQEY